MGWERDFADAFRVAFFAGAGAADALFRPLGLAMTAEVRWHLSAG